MPKKKKEELEEVEDEEEFDQGEDEDEIEEEPPKKPGRHKGFSPKKKEEPLTKEELLREEREIRQKLAKFEREEMMDNFLKSAPGEIMAMREDISNLKKAQEQYDIIIKQLQSNFKLLLQKE